MDLNFTLTSKSERLEDQIVFELENDRFFILFNDIMYKIKDKNFSYLDPQRHKITAAKFGGPIAAIRNNLKLSYITADLDDPFKKHLCFFSNSGEL